MKRRLLLWLLFVIFFGIVISRLPEIGKLLETLGKGHWAWIVAAAALALGRYVNFAGIFESAFDIVGVRSRTIQLLPVMFASVFVNTVAPLGGFSGFALFVDDAARRGQSGARASAGTLLALTSEYTSFGLVLALGYAYLAAHGALTGYELAGAALLAVVIFGLAIALILALWRPKGLLALFSWIQGSANSVVARFKRPPVFPADWAAKNAKEFTHAAQSMAAHPERLARTLGVALLMHVVNMLCVYTLFLAFYKPIGIGELIAVFGVGMLFWMVSITPQGIGLVEGAMVLVCTSLGVSAAQATAITLAFRGLSFWLPLVAGLIMVRTLRTFKAESKEPGKE